MTAQVIVTVSGKEDKDVLKNMLSMLSSFFDYLESEDKIKTCLRHYQQY